MASPEIIRISALEMEKYYSLQQAVSLLYTLLEKTAAPICAKDIGDLLMKEFAFLSGGRGKDNGWIITLPENTTFHEVPETVIKTVLTYLTSIPSKEEDDIKFIVILDRRMDTWTSVKLTLQKLSVSGSRDIFFREYEMWRKHIRNGQS